MRQVCQEMVVLAAGRHQQAAQKCASMQQTHLWPVLAIALLNPLSFILVLTALTFSP